MAERMARAIANRMAGSMRLGWQTDAPNPNPNPNPKFCSSVPLPPHSSPQVPHLGAREVNE